jgi:hypothetical protein
MKATIVIGLACALVHAGAAQQVLIEFDWQQLTQSHEISGGLPVSVEGQSALKVVNTNNTPLQARLLTIRNPPTTKNVYAIVGEVRCEGVRGTGYLEMWNYFPPPRSGAAEAAYFSRTLAESGEMGKLADTSGWRGFTLPFDHTGITSSPVRLELNLFLPAQGTVYLGSLKLVQYKGSLAEVRSASTNAWWPDHIGGFIGGVGGGVIGTLGSLLAWLASKGRARGFVLTSVKGMIVLGVLSTAAGLVALTVRQPYGVWFVLLLLGVLLLAILPARLKDYQRRYHDLEIRRMAALDA